LGLPRVFEQLARLYKTVVTLAFPDTTLKPINLVRGEAEGLHSGLSYYDISIAIRFEVGLRCPLEAVVSTTTALCDFGTASLSGHRPGRWDHGRRQSEGRSKAIGGRWK